MRGDHDDDGLARRTLLKGAVAAGALTAPSVVLAQAPSPRTKSAEAQPARQGPAAGGFSKARLQRMHDVMQSHVQSERVPGLVTLLHRHGETLVDTIGTLAFGSSAPMRRDTIFRVASISKPVTAAAAMILVEEGKLRLDDPVDKFLPELKDRKVLRSLESRLDDTIPANRPITARDLLTFRAGIGAIMVFPSKYPIQKAMEETGVAAGPFLFSGGGNDEFMKRIGSLPLVHQPGEKWLYHTGLDILGVLLARISGKSLGDFLRERIFDPLGMKDTGFHVPAAKIDGLATGYITDFSNGKTVVFDEARGGKFASPAVFELGGGGFVSTVDDFLAFGRMMMNKGMHGNERILSRLSIELMTTDQITPEQKAASPFFTNFWHSRGWGFGLSIITRRDELAHVPGRYGWDGGYGTSFYCDPKEDLVGILMTQRVWDSPSAPAVLQDFWNTAYAAIDD